MRLFDARSMLATLVLLPTRAIAAPPLPVAEMRNVPETLFGTTVDDPYRYFEDDKAPEVAAWMRTHSDYAHATLRSIPGRDTVLRKIERHDASAPARVREVTRLADGKVFHQRRGAKEDQFKLYVRDGFTGRERLLFDPETLRKATGKSHAVTSPGPKEPGEVTAISKSRRPVLIRWTTSPATASATPSGSSLKRWPTCTRSCSGNWACLRTSPGPARGSRKTLEGGGRPCARRCRCRWQPAWRFGRRGDGGLGNPPSGGQAQVASLEFARFSSRRRNPPLRIGAAMSEWIWWMVLAFGLLILELLTGTFYLMVIAAALAAGGIASLAGAPFALQLVVAAVIGFGGALALRQSRFGQLKTEGDTLQNLDVGQIVRIDGWSAANTARAMYRGAEWDVQLAPGERPAPGEFVIQAVHGSRLVVAARKTT